jgi:hypothetical protein
MANAVGMVRRFVEDYHEKLEEDRLFPRFTQKGKLVDLVKVLYQQGQVGRQVTDYLMANATSGALKSAQKRADLAKYLGYYIRMYRPPAPREATVNPESDKAGRKEVGYNASADRRSWQHLKDFFQEIFTK